MESVQDVYVQKIVANVTLAGNIIKDWLTKSSFVQNSFSYKINPFGFHTYRHLKKFGPSVRLKLRCIQRTCRVVGDPLKPSKSLNKGTKLTKRRKRDSSNERNEYLEPPRHCYGPTCMKQSRPGSKYCSDDCGLKLATSRIYQVLPQRIQEWSLTTCIAEQNNRRALETVRKQQHDVRRILQELEKRHIELDRIVERAKHASIDPQAEVDDNDDTESSMYCITCGHEVNSRTAIKHMEKCFNKVLQVIGNCRLFGFTSS